jgi:hypothetical protein
MQRVTRHISDSVCEISNLSHPDIPGLEDLTLTVNFSAEWCPAEPDAGLQSGWEVTGFSIHMASYGWPSKHWNGNRIPNLAHIEDTIVYSSTLTHAVEQQILPIIDRYYTPYPEDKEIAQ